METGADSRAEDFRNLEPWRVFRIMAELVEGVEHMEPIKNGVSIFGSARTPPDTPYYNMARQTAFLLAEAGFDVITGGGGGIMEAANRGASESAQGCTVGLNIDLPFEQDHNAYIKKLISFRYFFIRKLMFTKYARAIIAMPGGFGTFDELFENLTMIQTHKCEPAPMVLMGREYWAGLLAWLQETVEEREQMISPGDLDLMKITDDPAEAVQHITSELGKPHREK